jgi:hypothetical protein
MILRQVSWSSQEGDSHLFVKEIRQSPLEVAMESRVISRTNAGVPSLAAKILWLRRRDSG